MSRESKEWEGLAAVKEIEVQAGVAETGRLHETGRNAEEEVILAESEEDCGLELKL